MTISYSTIDDTTKMQIADLLSKMEAIEALLADIQTERAMGIVIAIGSIITLLMNLAIQIWDKIKWK